MSARTASPFGKRGGAVLALAGIVLFVFTLWAAGNQMDQPQQGGAPALRTGGRGFDGYAAFAQFLGKRGYTVDPLQSEAMAGQPGLLVLTPPHGANLQQMERVIALHRANGPVLVILPKWKSSGVVQRVPDGKYKGTVVEQLDAAVPRWLGWHDELAIDLYPLASKSSKGRWAGLGAAGNLPGIEAVQSAQGDGLVPLVTDTETDRVLAGYLDDGDYPALRDAADYDEPESKPYQRTNRFPLVLVFEPDLLNNWGFAKIESGRLAENMVRLTAGRGERRIIMDQMIEGAVAQPPRKGPSLIKQAFTPPFLAATICLILTALVLFWRALHRFGPPLLAARSIAFGKRALIANAAGLIQRARRLHLLGAPYADAARERLARKLALSARLDPAGTETAIDRALLVRAPGSEPFSIIAARLRAARRPADLVSAARQLHALERTLMR
ncbi:DUF4350 domain-containing protein [Novosphingobium sp.]|uniref:DUF4350 domain-containing protein n=1 Tax=Novosphingobium sp. TaxID=1874826 RepID=UPI00286B538B|nr:DUF4350 domain-containing protein [Novosphingobium sp.]